MLFTSPGFYLFAILVFVLYRTFPMRVSRWMLVFASYIFYGAAEPWYCGILLSSTLIDFYAARKIHACEVTSTKRKWLWVSVLSNLSLLGFFKYANFTLENLNFLFGLEAEQRYPYLDIVLPIGISFYTFQTLSYTIDVYRGRQKPTSDFGSFALYVAFFPQLVAGPIERARNLLSQFENPVKATREDIEYGLQRILWGVAKKVIVADRFAVVVSGVYQNPASFSSLETVIATICFSFQLYLDFSAYTDIAIGLARMFGIRLSENFNYPFLARNPSDFWSRWHITLTTWFRDYVYTSVGGTRRNSLIRTALAILLVMGLMGLWHGAEWHYVVFGLLSGGMVVVYILLRLLTGRKQLLGRSLASMIVAITGMNIVINFIMIFFRAPSLDVAMHIIQNVYSGSWTLDQSFFLPVAMLLVVATLHCVFGAMARRIHDYSFPPLARGATCASLFLAINFLAIDTSEQFIYFRF